jgi:hypothetical protein
MNHSVSLTRRQIGALEMIAAVIEPDDYGTVVSVGSADDMIEVELRHADGYGSGIGKRYTRYIDSEGSFWRYDSETDKMLRAHITPEHGSCTWCGNTVHYVF